MRPFGMDGSGLWIQIRTSRRKCFGSGVGMNGKIPATVVTGFLGAGKTTLIRHLLERSAGKRIALIINEFGDLGVDGEILRGCGIDGCDEDSIVELSNGCICCTVAEEFAPTIKSLVSMERPPDHIVIETSGLALPQPLVRAFNWPELRNRLTVDGVVALLDGPAIEAGQFAHDLGAIDRQRREDDSLDHETPLAELFEDQLACADLVVINKADLLTDDGLDRVKSTVKMQLRPGVATVAAEMGAVDPLAVLGIDANAESDAEARAELHHHHSLEEEEGPEDDHNHDEFDSVVIDLPEIARPDTFLDGVSQVMRLHGLLRVKGFAAVEGKPMRLIVQAVGPRVGSHYDRSFGAGEARCTKLVAIAETGADWREVKRALRQAVAA